MPGRYDQTELNIYGAKDDEQMDAILDALDRAGEHDPAGSGQGGSRG